MIFFLPFPHLLPLPYFFDFCTIYLFVFTCFDFLNFCFSFPALDPPSAGPSKISLGLPGFHTTLQTCTFEGPGLQKHHQNSTRRPPERERKTREDAQRERKKKERKWRPEREKKRKLLGLPPFGPTLHAEALWARTFSGFGPLRSSFNHISYFLFFVHSYCFYFLPFFLKCSLFFF